MSIQKGRNLTHISIHPILFLDSAIVQISDLDKLLLVSNYAKCILCNVDNEEFKQVSSETPPTNTAQKLAHKST